MNGSWTGERVRAASSTEIAFFALSRDSPLAWTLSRHVVLRTPAYTRASVLSNYGSFRFEPRLTDLRFSPHRDTQLFLSDKEPIKVFTGHLSRPFLSPHFQWIIQRKTKSLERERDRERRKMKMDPSTCTISSIVFGKGDFQFTRDRITNFKIPFEDLSSLLKITDHRIQEGGRLFFPVPGNFVRATAVCLSLCFPSGEINGDSLTKSSIVWRYTCPAGNSRNSAKFPARSTLRRQRVHKARLFDITISGRLIAFQLVYYRTDSEKPIRKAGFRRARLIFFWPGQNKKKWKFPTICPRLCEREKRVADSV